MSSPRVLVLDSDPSSLGLLTHGMNRLGLKTNGAADLDQALASLAADRPDVVVSEMAGGAGLKVLEELRQNPKTRDIPMLLMAKGAWVRRRAEALELGAQEAVAKPAFVQDIAVLTWLYAGHSSKEEWFEGTFGEPSCAALLRGLLAGGRTGTLRLDPSGAVVQFREGAVVGASLYPLEGERALLRILTLGTGSYELTFGPLTVRPTMQFELNDLLSKGLLHVRQWEEVRAQLTPMEQILTVNFEALSGQLDGLPAGLWNLLRLFDGKRSVSDVISDSALDDLTAGRSIAKLKAMGLFEQRGRESWDGPTPAILPAAVPMVVEAFAPHDAPNADHELPPLASDYDEEPGAMLSGAEGQSTPLILLNSMMESERARLHAESQAALRAEADFERAFFDSPVEHTEDHHLDHNHDLAHAVVAHKAPRSNGRLVRTIGWTLVAAAFTASAILLWNGTPDGRPNVAAEPAPAVAVAPAPTPAIVPAPLAPIPTKGADADLRALMDRSEQEYDEGQFEMALDSLDRARAINPNDSAVELARGLMLYELGRLDASGATLAHVVELEPNNARAQLLLGAIAQEKGDAATARAHYEKYLALDPNGEHVDEAQKLIANLD